MPTYTYKCEKCNRVIDRFVKMDDRNKQVCDKCNGKMIMLITAPALIGFDNLGRS